jgi:hypothetical protein
MKFTFVIFVSFIEKPQITSPKALYSLGISVYLMKWVLCEVGGYCSLSLPILGARKGANFKPLKGCTYYKLNNCYLGRELFVQK